MRTLANLPCSFHSSTSKQVFNNLVKFSGVHLLGCTVVKEVATSKDKHPNPPKVIFDRERPGQEPKEVAHNPSTLENGEINNSLYTEASCILSDGGAVVWHPTVLVNPCRGSSCYM